MQQTTHLNGTHAAADTPNGTAPPAEKQPAPGRDAKGRFGKGNLGGPGNPFARQIAGFRRALCNAVTEQDIAELAGILRAKARGGDVQAMKLLFQYTLGRPAEATDPDSLDAQEMRLFRQNDVESDTMTELTQGTPAELAVKVLRVLLPTRAQQIAGAMSEMLRSIPEPPAVPPQPETGESSDGESAARARRVAKLLRKLEAKKCRRERRGAGRPVVQGPCSCHESVNGSSGLGTDEKRCKRRLETAESTARPAQGRLGDDDLSLFAEL